MKSAQIPKSEAVRLLKDVKGDAPYSDNGQPNGRQMPITTTGSLSNEREEERVIAMAELDSALKEMIHKKITLDEIETSTAGF